MKNNVLFLVTNIDLIEKLKGLKINNFVFPLSFFCVGVPNTFDINDIKEDNAYLFINRILDSQDIDRLNELLHNLPSNIKGIIFDDVGIIEITQDLKLEKILYLSHFNTNYESINYFFDYVDDIIISTDITEEEIDEIITKAKKKVSLFTFGLVPSLYSRRNLLSFYGEHYGLKKEDMKNLHIGDKRFIAIENKYGMMLYHYPYFNGKRLLNKDVHYYFYYPILLNDNQIIQIANNNFDIVETDNGFLDTKTIYKVKNSGEGGK